MGPCDIPFVISSHTVPGRRMIYRKVKLLLPSSTKQHKTAKYGIPLYPACSKFRPHLGIVQLMPSWAVVCKIQWRIWASYRMVLMVDAPVWIISISVMANSFDSHSLFPRSRASSSLVDGCYRWFLTRMTWLHNAPMTFNGNLYAVKAWLIILKRDNSRSFTKCLLYRGERRIRNFDRWRTSKLLVANCYGN